MSLIGGGVECVSSAEACETGVMWICVGTSLVVGDVRFVLRVYVRWESGPSVCVRRGDGRCVSEAGVCVSVAGVCVSLSKLLNAVLSDSWSPVRLEM